jgi:hypothetical protein
MLQMEIIKEMSTSTTTPSTTTMQALPTTVAKVDAWWKWIKEGKKLEEKNESRLKEFFF